MTICKICGRDDGHHHDHEEFFICARCYPIIAPLVEVRKEQLARLRSRAESTTADNINKADRNAT